MTGDHFREWQPIRLYGQGVQPRTGKHWNCLPAWDVTAICAEADGEIPHPDHFRAANGQGDFPKRDEKKYVFWNRHVDRRFHIEYPHATKASPRAQGKTIRDTDREWDTLTEYRDRYLREAGLTLQSPPTEIARCLAETFAAVQFEKKPMCETFAENPRELMNAMEGLVHRSFCVGCAQAFAALADACGLPVRTVGCGGHRVAEVRLGGRWHLVDSVGRHPHNRGLDVFFRGSFMGTSLDAMGDWGESLSDNFRNGLWGRPNGQYHFPMGMWDTPCTLRFSTNNAFAIYPGAECLGITSLDGKRLPIIARSGGFYWPSVHGSCADDLQAVRAAALPLPMFAEPTFRDYLYHPFRPGEKLRQSIWLDDLDGIVEMELVFLFGASKASDFSERIGQQLTVKVGDFEKSLSDMGAWPPARPGADAVEGPLGGQNFNVAVKLPPEVFAPNAVNWIELRQGSAALFYVPGLPAAMEPYIAPLWSETADRHNPPLPALG